MSQKWHFSEGLTQAFGQKMQFLSFVFAQNKIRSRAY